jgi:molecular chaperone GrpE
MAGGTTMPDTNPPTDENNGDATVPRSAPDDRDLAKELSETKDRLLRTLAEQENVRTQARKGVEEALGRGARGLAADILASMDSLERAIASVPEDKRSDPTVQTLLSGVEATRRALLDALGRHGIHRFDPAGEEFDPHRHEASFEIADGSVPAGIVTEVVQPGYMHHDRLLRPALVGVSRQPQ